MVLGCGYKDEILKQVQNDEIDSQLLILGDTAKKSGTQSKPPGGSKPQSSNKRNLLYNSVNYNRFKFFSVTEISMIK